MLTYKKFRDVASVLAHNYQFVLTWSLTALFVTLDTMFIFYLLIILSFYLKLVFITFHYIEFFLLINNEKSTWKTSALLFT